MLILAVFSETIGKFLYKRIFYRLRKIEYEDSLTNKVAENLGQAATIGLVCYFFDMVEIALEVAGIKDTERDFSTLIAKLMYITWATFRVRFYKRNFF